MSKVQFVNLTPHPITLYRADGETETVQPSGMVARVSAERYVADEAHPYYHHVDIVTYSRTGVYLVDKDGNEAPMPEPKYGTAYLVSRMVLDEIRAAGNSRSDVFAPDTDQGAVRDETGRIIGTRALVMR